MLVAMINSFSLLHGIPHKFVKPPEDTSNIGPLWNVSTMWRVPHSWARWWPWFHCMNTWFIHVNNSVFFLVYFLYLFLLWWATLLRTLFCLSLEHTVSLSFLAKSRISGYSMYKCLTLLSNTRFLSKWFYHFLLLPALYENYYWSLPKFGIYIFFISRDYKV